MRLRIGIGMARMSTLCHKRSSHASYMIYVNALDRGLGECQAAGGTGTLACAMADAFHAQGTGRSARATETRTGHGWDAAKEEMLARSCRALMTRGGTAALHP